MNWFRLHTEFAHDPKLRTFTQAERYSIVVVFCLAAESRERGVVLLDDEDVAACLEMSQEAYASFIERLARKRIVERRADGGLVVVHWMERQYDKPSDRPEAAARRKREERARKKEQQEEPADAAGQDTAPDPPEPAGRQPVTPESRAVTPEAPHVTPESRAVTPAGKEGHASSRAIADITDIADTDITDIKKGKQANARTRTHAREGVPVRALVEDAAAALSEREGLLEMLVERGVGEAAAAQLVVGAPAEHVRRMIERFDAENADGASHRPGWLVSSIEQGYQALGDGEAGARSSAGQGRKKRRQAYTLAEAIAWCERHGIVLSETNRLDRYFECGGEGDRANLYRLEGAA